MTKHHAENERVKRKYFTYLKEAMRNSEPTVDAAAKAMARFEGHTKYKDFKAFHFEQAVAFKRHLAEQDGKSGKKLSKATLHGTLTQLKRFFQWLAREPGYKSRIRYNDAGYFNLSDKDTRIATARREQKAPTLEQVKHVINTMPANTDIELRNRALIAFTLLTGARDSAIASMKLKHVDLVENRVNQDAREVHTKFSKTFPTFFICSVGEEVREIVAAWVTYLREEKLWGNDDPLFPATQIVCGASRQFEVAGLAKNCWSNATPIRTIFREAFTGAGLPYFNPHSLRNTLVKLGEKICKTPEDFKSWSQNLGHEKVLTTFTNYGEVACQRQGEIIRGLATPQQAVQPDVNELAKAIAREMRSSGVKMQAG